MKVFVTVRMEDITVMPAPPDDNEFPTIQQLVTVRPGESLGGISYEELRKLSTGNHEVDLTIRDFEKFESSSNKKS